MAMTEIVRASCDLPAFVANLQRMALGQPMFRYKDASGKTCVTGTPPPEGATDIRECYPTDADQMRAIETVWQHLEPATKKLDVTISRGLDAQSQYPLERFTPEKLDAFIELTGELAEPEPVADDEETSRHSSIGQEPSHRE